jgi:hypothetical protein
VLEDCAREQVPGTAGDERARAQREQRETDDGVVVDVLAGGHDGREQPEGERGGEPEVVASERARHRQGEHPGALDATRRPHADGHIGRSPKQSEHSMAQCVTPVYSSSWGEDGVTLVEFAALKDY